MLRDVVRTDLRRVHAPANFDLHGSLISSPVKNEQHGSPISMHVWLLQFQLLWGSALRPAVVAHFEGIVSCLKTPHNDLGQGVNQDLSIRTPDLITYHRAFNISIESQLYI